MLEKLIAGYGVFWVVLLLGRAIGRLAPIAIETWTAGSMTAMQIAIYLGWVVLNAYAEGYRAFQLKFCPRVVARAIYLGRHPTALRIILALPFCMSLFFAKRRQKIVSWTFIVVLVAVVIAVRKLPQPWRGIIDGGVVVGLAWGVVMLVWYYVRYVLGIDEPKTEDIPDAFAAQQT